jgi:hypothetical protein
VSAETLVERARRSGIAPLPVEDWEESVADDLTVCLNLEVDGLEGSNGERDGREEREERGHALLERHPHNRVAPRELIHASIGMAESQHHRYGQPTIRESPLDFDEYDQTQCGGERVRVVRLDEPADGAQRPPADITLGRDIEREEDRAQIHAAQPSTCAKRLAVAS